MYHLHMKTINITTVNYSLLVSRISTEDSLVDLDKRFLVKPRHHVFFSFESRQNIPWIISIEYFQVKPQQKVFSHIISTEDSLADLDRRFPNRPQ